MYIFDTELQVISACNHIAHYYRPEVVRNYIEPFVPVQHLLGIRFSNVMESLVANPVLFQNKIVVFCHYNRHFDEVLPKENTKIIDRKRSIAAGVIVDHDDSFASVADAVPVFHRNIACIRR